MLSHQPARLLSRQVVRSFREIPDSKPPTGGFFIARRKAMAQTSRLVLEIDSRDAEQKAADTRKALEALEGAGLRVKPAMDKAGDGMEGAGKSAEKAKSLASERDEIESLLGRIDPLTKKLGELDRQEQEFARHRKRPAP
jgi:hypothetical protein